MTDEDVVRRVAVAFGVSMCRSSRNPDCWRAAFYAQVRGESAVRLMKALYPLMGGRRQGQIDKAVSSWKPRGRRLRPEDEERILQLLGEGKSYREAGRLAGFSRTAVGSVAAKNKVS
jgi:hypothetical protein